MNNIITNTAITKSTTNDSYCNCTIIDIFEIERNDDLGKQFMGNARWLWHGTKLHCLNDIIKSGLKIAEGAFENFFGVFHVFSRTSRISRFPNAPKAEGAFGKIFGVFDVNGYG